MSKFSKWWIKVRFTVVFVTWILDMAMAKWGPKSSEPLFIMCAAAMTLALAAYYFEDKKRNS